MKVNLINLVGLEKYYVNGLKMVGFTPLQKINSCWRIDYMVLYCQNQWNEYLYPEDVHKWDKVSSLNRGRKPLCFNLKLLSFRPFKSRLNRFSK